MNKIFADYSKYLQINPVMEMTDVLIEGYQGRVKSGYQIWVKDEEEIVKNEGPLTVIIEPSVKAKLITNEVMMMTFGWGTYKNIDRTFSN